MTATYRLYLESGPKMRTTMVHVFDLLGCLANGKTTEAALEAAPSEIRRFLAFLQRHGEGADPKTDFRTEIAQHVMEGTWIGYGDPAPGFAPDFEPLSRSELRACTRRLGWLGEDLSGIARTLTPEQLSEKPKHGRRIGEIFAHVAGAEPEYVRTAGLGKPEAIKARSKEIQSTMEGLPDNIERLLQAAAERFEAASDEELTEQTQRGEKLYTLRRGLRRALEHPWEHLREIERRLGR